MVALRPAGLALGERSSRRLTGHVAGTKGIGAGRALSGGGRGRELLALDEGVVDKAFVDHGSETGRAEEHSKRGWEAHFGSRRGGMSAFGR